MTVRGALAACVLLLVVFGTLAMSAALRESATFDEPVQTVAGWIKLRRGDFRLNIEDPPLWEEWAALPNGKGSLKPEFESPEWRDLLDTPAKQWRFVTRSLWNTPGIDGGAFVNRSRAMMLVVGLCLGVFVAFWAWRLAGPVAGLAALALYALDPNFLAHSALVKNDVPATLLMLVFAWFTWMVGQRLTWGRLCGLALTVGLALNIKFSCVLLAPMLLVLLCLRAAAPEPWPMAEGSSLAGRPQRFAAALAIAAFVGLVSVACIWAAYRFRFGATPNPAEHIDTKWVVDHLQRAQVAAGSRPEPWTPDVVTRLTLWMLSHRLLPESWLNGFLFTYATAVLRRGFLLGTLSPTGFWYYFPVAILMKTPLATLAAGTLATALVAGRLVRNGWRRFSFQWGAACLLVPPAIYLYSSMRTHMNIGIRHVLPLYGFAYVVTGVLAGFAAARWGRRALGSLAVLCALLAVETGASYPHYIAFFNAAAGGSRNGIHLLGDSNLDWGQDLPLLAQWQARNPDRRLYLSYFGMADPSFHGIRYEPLAGNYYFGPKPGGQPIQPPAVVAISASHLQGISIGPPLGDRLAPVRQLQPAEVLGGTIYLFDVPDEMTAGSFRGLTVP